MSDLITNINQAASDFSSIKQAIIDKGVDVPNGTKTEEYGNLIRSIQSGDSSEQLGIYPIDSDCKPTGNVNIPDNVTSLPNTLFRNNSNVLTVALSNNLSSIQGQSFYGCSNLTSIHFPASLTTIGEECFKNCSNLADVTFDAETSIILGGSSFVNCSLLTDKSVENILKHSSSIYGSVFENCTGLRNITIGILWNNLFSSCTGLISVTVNSQKQGSTGDYCFKNCTSLQEVYINRPYTSIGYAVFSNCTSLKTVFLPSSITQSNNLITSSSDYIFYNCTALEDVQLGKDWNASLRLDVSNNLTVDSMVAMFESLKDLTNETTKTLTLGSINLDKLTDEQKAAAINKKWTLA